MVSQPLAVVNRSPAAAAALAEEAEGSSSSSGNWVIPLDEEIEALADQLAAAASNSSGSSSLAGSQRTQVGYVLKVF